LLWSLVGCFRIQLQGMGLGFNFGSMGFQFGIY
jgi:hypothetical protein